MSVDAKWRSVISDGMAALEREQTGSPCPVVDHEVALGRADDGFTVWLICRNVSEQFQFRDRELSRTISSLRRKLLAAGVPEPVVDSLRVRVTSRDEVERGGGYSGLR